MAISESKGNGNEVLRPFVLEPLLVERVWGAKDLRPWYGEHASSIGEAWLTAEKCVVQTGALRGMSIADVEASHPAELLGATLKEFPLLVKMLFPADWLSVQVHPDDALAHAMREETGADVRAKSECWYALSSTPGANLWLGLKSGTSATAWQTALGSKAMEALLQSETVTAGDMFNVPAGTVHAIGPGMILLEVQQPSDTTYRLWDYGRPRELHLAQGERATKLSTQAGRSIPKEIGGGMQLLATEHIIVERYDLAPEGEAMGLQTQGLPEAIIAIDGLATVVCTVSDGEFKLPVEQGRAAVIPASTSQYRLEGPCSLVRCRVPQNGNARMLNKIRVPKA